MAEPQDRVALVTGASRGIGRAVALELATQGAAVAITYLSRSEEAQQVVSAIEASGGQGVALQSDVSQPGTAEALVENVAGALGPITILVNNAGITRDALLLRMKDEDWDAVIATSLGGAFRCMRACAKQMVKQRHGRIINMSSVVGVRGNAGQANYAAAKAGLIGLTKAAAKELAPRGITVNAVTPGFIETEMTAGLADNLREQVVARIAAARFGSPEEVAGLVAYLASDRAGYVNGAVIGMDGGLAL